MEVDDENPFECLKSGKIVMKASIVSAVWDVMSEGWMLPGTFAAFEDAKYADQDRTITQLVSTGLLSAEADAWVEFITRMHGTFNVDLENNIERRVEGYDLGVEIIRDMHSHQFMAIAPKDRWLLDATMEAVYAVDAIIEANMEKVSKAKTMGWGQSLHRISEVKQEINKILGSALEQSKKPVRRMVHESIIPPGIIQGGILGMMIKVSSLSKEEREARVIVDVFEN